MAELRDLLGRISALDESLISMTEKVMAASNAMGKAVEFINESSGGGKSGGEISASVQKLTDALSGIVPNIRAQIDQGKEVVKALEEFKKASEEDRDKRQQSEAKSLKGEDNIRKAITSLNSSIKQLNKKVSGPTEKLGMVAGSSGTRNRTGTPGNSGGGGGRGGGGGGPTVGTPDPGNFNNDMERIGREGAAALELGLKYESKRRLASWMTGISTALMGGTGDLFQTMFAGSVRDMTKFREEARLLAFELEGINESTRGMQASFADIGKVAKQTGKSVDVMQRVFLKNMQKGFKGQGDILKKTLKSGLQLSTMIGSETDATAELFSDWSRFLGMSADQMSQMATDAKNIARSTGVTGDELLGAMKSSEAILKNLRNQGNLTSSATRNVIEGMAEAKKFGVEDKFSQLADMMTSTNKFMEGDNQTRMFIQKMGGTDAALTGTGMEDKANLKMMAANMDQTIRQFTGNKASGVEGIKDLDKDAKMVLARQLSVNFGMEIYEFEKIFEILQKNSRTLGDQFKELEQTANNENESAEKRALAQQQMTGLMADAGMTFANKFVDIARKDGKSVSDALNEASAAMNEGDKQDMQSLLSKANLDPSTLAQADSFGAGSDQIKAMLVAAKAMSDRGKEVGVNVEDLGPEILKAAEKARTTGESGDLVALIDKMQETGKEIDVASKTNVTPMEKLSQEINKLNETIRGLASGPLGMLIDALGWVGLALTQVALQAGMLYVLLPSKFADFAIGLKGLRLSLGDLGKRMGDLGGGWLNTLNRTRTTPTPLLNAGSTNMFSRNAERLAGLFGKIADVLNNFSVSLEWFGKVGIRKGIWNIKKGLMGFKDSLEWFGKVGIHKGIWNIKKGLAGLSDSIGATRLVTNITKALDFKNLISVVKFIFNPFKQLSLMFRLLQKGFSGLSMALKKVPVIGWLFMAVDGVIGAVEGYKKAGDIFGVETDKLTQGMKISAGAAGGVVGVLDGLTFGLLRMTGVAGPLTEFLAKLFYGFTYLAKGFQDSLMSWMPSIQESLKSVGQAFGELWAMFAGIFGFNIASETDGWKAFYDMMGMVGSILGAIVGGGLKLLIDILYAAIQVIKAVVWYFSTWINMLRAIGTAITTLSFQPIIDFFGKLGTDILGALGKVFSDLSGWVGSWFGWGKKPESPPATPQVALADGGITTGPTNALIGEAGPEAVIPLDKLGGMMSNNVVAGSDFAKEKALGEQKKLNDFSRSSNNSLKNLERRASTASEGLYVKDTKTHTMLQLLFSQLGYVYESLEAGLNFISQGEEAKMQRARAGAKLKRMETSIELANAYGDTAASEVAIQEMNRSTKEATVAGAIKGKNNEETLRLRNTNWAKEHEKRFQELEGRKIAIQSPEAKVATAPAPTVASPEAKVAPAPTVASPEAKVATAPTVASPEAKVAPAPAVASPEAKVAPAPAVASPEAKVATAEVKVSATQAATSPDVNKMLQDVPVENIDKALAEKTEYREMMKKDKKYQRDVRLHGETIAAQNYDARQYANNNSPPLTAAATPPAPAVASPEAKVQSVADKAVSDSGNFEQNYKTVPKEMWSSMDHVDASMSEQTRAYAESKTFDESAQIAKKREEEGFVEYDIGKKMTLGESTDKGLDERTKKAVAKLEAENKETIAAMDAEIEREKKKYLSDVGDKRGHPIFDRTKYTKENPLEDYRAALAKKRNFYDGNIEKYYDEIAAPDSHYGIPGGDPSMIYETKDQALDRATKHKKQRVETEQATVSGLEKELEDLKKELSQTPSGRGSENAEKRMKLERRIADIEGTSNWWTPDSISGGAQGTHGPVYHGELAAAQSRLEIAQSELNPSTVQREAVMKNPYADMASDAVLEQNVEQTKKLGTVEEASAKSLEPGSIYVHDIHLEKLLSGIAGDRLSLAATKTAAAIDSSSAYHSTPVGQHAIPAMKEDEDGVAQVQPVHLRDIAESILKDKVGGESGTSKLQSDELARMEEIANKQYAEMQQMREGIQEMVSIFKSSGTVGSSSGESPRTKFFRNHVKPTVYGQMTDGKPGSGPNRSVHKTF